MAASSTARTISVRLSLDDLDKVKAGLKGLGDDAEGAFNRVTAAADGTGRSTATLVARLDPAVKATTQLSDAAGKLAAAEAYLTQQMAKGGEAADKAAASLKLVQAASAQVTDIQGKLTAGTVSGAAASAQLQKVMSGHTDLLDKNTAATKLNFTQLEILRSGVVNTVQSIAAGLPVGQTLLTQTVQTAPALAGMGTAALAAAAPFAILAAGIGVLVVAHVQANAELKETNRVLTLAGGAAGVTSSQFYDLADQAAKAGGITRASALALQQSYAATGKIGGDMLSKLAGETKAWATLTAQSTDEAAGELARYFSDPSAAAQQLAKSLNLLSLQQVQTIQSMDRTGNSAGAQVALFNAIKDRADQAKDSLGYFGNALNNIADIWERLKRVGAPDALPPVQRLAAVTAEYDAVLKQLRADQDKAANDDDYVSAVAADQQKLTALARQAEDLRRSIASQANQEVINGNKAAANDLGVKVAPVINALPTEQVKALRDEVSLLDKAVAAGVITDDQRAQALQAVSAQIQGLEPVYQKWTDQQRIEQQVLAADPALRDQVRAKLEAQLAAKTQNASADEKNAMAAGAEQAVVRTRNDAYQQGVDALTKSTAATLKVADAYGISAEAGLREAEVAKVQDQARTNLTIRANQQAVVERNLAAASAASYAALVQQVQQLDVTTQQQDALAAASALGTKALSDQTIANQAAVMVQKALNDAKAAHITLTQQDIEVKRQEIEADLKQQALDQQRVQADASLRSANDNNAYLRVEIDTLGQDAAARAVVLARMKEELELREQQPGLFASQNAEDQQRIRNLIDAAGYTAQLTAENERLGQAYQDLSGLGDTTFDAIIQKVVQAGDATTSWKDVLHGVVAEIETMGLKMALINPLKNAAFGTNLPTLDDLSKVTGSASSSGGLGQGLLSFLGISGGANDNQQSAFDAVLNKYSSAGSDAAGSGSILAGLSPFLGVAGQAIGLAGLGSAGGSLIGSITGGNQSGASIGGLVGALGGLALGAGPVGLVADVALGGLFGSLFPEDKQYPWAQASSVGGKQDAISSLDGQGTSEFGKALTAAMSSLNGLATSLGIDPSSLPLGGFGYNTAGRPGDNLPDGYYSFIGAGGFGATDAKAAGSADEAVFDFIKRSLQAVSGTLDADVRTALANSGASTVQDLQSDLAFAKGFKDSVAAYTKGLTSQTDAQTAAKTSMESTIASLLDFRKQTAALGLDTAAATAGTNAYIRSILGITAAAPVLDDAQQKVAAINGAVAAVIPNLGDFGLTLDEVNKAASAAKAQLLSGTLDQVTALWLQAGDAAEQAAYQAQQLLAQQAQYITDVQAEGGGQDAVDQVNRTFNRLIQNVVNQTGLTGAAFTEFLTYFPQLTGQLKEASAATTDATDATVAAAKAQALAQGKSAYLDALGITPTGVQALTAALSGSSGLDAIITAVAGDIDALNAAASTGADATSTFSDAFNAMTGLLNAGKISASDYTSALGVVTNAYKSSASAASQAASQLYSAGANIQAYIDKTKSGGVASYLSPTDQLANAKSAYQTQLGLAQGGNSTALGNITQYADTYIQDLVKTMGSGTDTTATINAVLAQLSALPATKSYNDQSLALLGQIAANTNDAAAYLAAADANGDKQITWAEFQSWGTANNSQLLAIGRLLNLPGGGDLASIFKAIDTNGDGIISASEQARISLLSALQALPSPTALQVGNALAPFFSSLDANTDGLLSKDEFMAGLQGKADNATLASWFSQLDANGDGVINSLEVTRAQLLTSLQNIAAPTGAQVAQQLGPYFSTLTASTNGLLTRDVFSQVLAGKADNATLGAWFAQLDANGDGLLSALEGARGAIVAGLAGIATPTAQQVGGALAPYFGALTASTNGLLSRDVFNQVLSGKASDSTLDKWFKELDTNGDGQLSKLETLNTSTKSVDSSVGDLSGSSSNGNTLGDMITQVYRGNVDRLNIYSLIRPILDDLNRWSLKITYNTAGASEALGGAHAYAGGTDYHPGGWAIVGERGPEIAWMPTGTKVWPNGVAPSVSSIGAAGGGTAGIEARLDRVVAALERLVDQTGQGNDDNTRALSAVAGEVRAVANAVRSPGGVARMATIGRG
ncbi:phage tail length tape measure family protein [Nitrospirillum bahiense]|uniref:Phage-related minor tail protein n=1 Tax=Nitrospirillum amazonense TaxID=28077 RepID=A0A560F1T6_9PROT|nr:phage tail length tape measure family protein [Nitrospirillum amazonense]TWB15592.1 phage-related minor tail protein [Nitrospirillum amazonense]